MDHLACFAPGMLILGAEGTRADADRELAVELMHTCYRMYADSPSGLAPEIAAFAHRTLVVAADQAKHFLLRPETSESLLIMWRLTGDPKYREWGWHIFGAIETHTKVPSGGYVPLKDVTLVPPPQDEVRQLLPSGTCMRVLTTALRPVPPSSPQGGRMESFFTAETLKYLYLLFGDGSEYPLSEYVFNTEAHPLRIHDEYRYGAWGSLPAEHELCKHSPRRPHFPSGTERAGAPYPPRTSSRQRHPLCRAQTPPLTPLPLRATARPRRSSRRQIGQLMSCRISEGVSSYVRPSSVRSPPRTEISIIQCCGTDRSGSSPRLEISLTSGRGDFLAVHMKISLTSGRGEPLEVGHKPEDGFVAGADDRWVAASDHDGLVVHGRDSDPRIATHLRHPLAAMWTGHTGTALSGCRASLGCRAASVCCRGASVRCDSLFVPRGIRIVRLRRKGFAQGQEACGRGWARRGAIQGRRGSSPG